jgi:aminodeoxyfutalosine deaminase
MDDFLIQMPKAELHVHLEGSIQPETLHELDPTTPIEECSALYRYADFDGFLKAFGAVGKRLRGPEDYAHITQCLLEQLAAQNVRYAEIIVAAGVVLWKGQDFGSIFQAIRDTAAHSPVRVGWILDAVRQFGAEQAMQVAEWAAARRGTAGPPNGSPKFSRSQNRPACGLRRMREKAPPPDRFGTHWNWERNGSVTESHRLTIRR